MPGPVLRDRYLRVVESSPQIAIEELVRRTQAAAAEPADTVSLRGAFETVLDELRVPPAERDAWSDGADVIGAAYERLFPAGQRRKAGQFFTPFWAGELMAEWIFRKPTKVLMDPGCGSGALLVPAASSPRRGAARLIGTDLDPLAVKMAARNRELRGLTGLDLYVSNFLLDDPPETPDALIVNPPYSRHHDIDAGVKAEVHEQLEIELGLKLSRLAALHVLFLVRALQISTDDARLAFITPSDWLDVNYGRAVKGYLLDVAQVEAIVVLDETRLFFDGVLTTAAITFIDKGRRNEKTRMIRLGDKLPAPMDVLTALDAENSSSRELVQLSQDFKWSRPRGAQPHGTRLGDLARIRRGIATGDNRFFVISEARRRERGISLADVERCATSPRQFEGDRLDEETFDRLPDQVPRWVIQATDPTAEKAQSPIGRYLRWGRRRRKTHLRYLASRRAPWYALERRADCPILFSYFNRARPRFVRNTAGAVPLNNWLIIEPKSGVSPDKLHRALTKEAVLGQLGARARVYGSGLWKLEPSELAEIRLPGRGLRSGE